MSKGAARSRARVIWSPQPRQRLFMARPEYEALYGGAAGGGKSDALVIEALRQVHIPHYKALILRKTFPQLSELIDKTQNYYPRAFPGARYNGSNHVWTFPSGAKILFGSMHRTQDRTRYQGHAYDFIAFDELTHFTFEEYSYLFSRNRPSGPGTRVYIRATANPGGVGHAWVKERFITAGPPMTPIRDLYEVQGPHGKIQIERSRIFIPATVFDNQALLDNDPNYLGNLAGMPEAEKQALLYGNWDSFNGQVFREWRNDPAHYDDHAWTHVIRPFRVPKHWTRYMGFDFGYSKPFSVGWYAVSEDGTIYRIKEYYGCTGTPNVGIQMQPKAIAAEIRRLEEEDENLRGCSIIRIADPAIFDESQGESIAHMMEGAPAFVSFYKGDHKRLPGKMQVHYRLAFDEEGRAKFYVFDTCKHFIRTIPSLVYDEAHVEDVDTAQEDHIYDECRYVLMASPIAPRGRMEIRPYQYDPLDIAKDDKPGEYEFFRI